MFCLRQFLAYFLPKYYNEYKKYPIKSKDTIGDLMSILFLGNCFRNLSRGFFGSWCVKGEFGDWQPTESISMNRLEMLCKSSFKILDAMKEANKKLPGNDIAAVQDALSNANEALKHQSSINADNTRINANLSQTVVDQQQELKEKQQEIKELRNTVQVLSSPPAVRPARGRGGRTPTPVTVPEDEDDEDDNDEEEKPKSPIAKLISKLSPKKRKKKAKADVEEVEEKKSRSPIAKFMDDRKKKKAEKKAYQDAARARAKEFAKADADALRRSSRNHAA